MTLPCLDLLLSQVWLEKMLTHFFQQENTSTSNKRRAWCQRSRTPHRSQPHPHWKIERWATPWQKARAGYWQSFKKPDFVDQTTSVRRVFKVSQVEITVGTEFLQQHYQLWWSSFDKGPGDPGSGRLAMKPDVDFSDCLVEKAVLQNVYIYSKIFKYSRLQATKGSPQKPCDAENVGCLFGH